MQYHPSMETHIGREALLWTVRNHRALNGAVVRGFCASSASPEHTHCSHLYTHPTGSGPSHRSPGPISKFISSLSRPPSQNPNSTQHPKRSSKLKSCLTTPNPVNSLTGFQLTQGQISICPQDLHQSGPCLPKVHSDHPLPHYAAGQWHRSFNSKD